MIPSLDLMEPRGRRLARWIGAATLIGALHFGGGAFAMLYWAEELFEEAAGAIVVEIAPVATAIATETHDRPPGQLSDEAEAKQAASAPKMEKSPEETPKEDLPSPAPDPEVALRKPTEVEEKPEDKPKEEPSPLVKAADVDTPASKATAPTRIQGEISTKVAAPDAGTAAANKRSIVSWQNAVVLHINHHKREYDADRGVQGDVYVRFVIDRSGQVVSLAVARASGYPLLDQEALALLKRAAPLPRPPPALAGETQELTIPIRFRQK